MIISMINTIGALTKTDSSVPTSPTAQFSARIATDGGTYETDSCLLTIINNLS